MKRHHSETTATTISRKNEPLVIVEMKNLASSYLELFWWIQQLSVCRLRGQRQHFKNDDDDDDDDDEQQNQKQVLLPPEIIHKIASFFTVRPVVSSEVRAVHASSTSGQHPLSAALDESESTWWISGLGSMPRGMGREYIEFQLSSDEKKTKKLCRLTQFAIKIPPLPMGPLSVRSFRLERKQEEPSSSSAPSNDESDDDEDESTSSWVPISPNWTVENKTGWQTFSFESPGVDAQNIRVVCRSNQMAEVMFMDEGGEMEERMAQHYASVGFYSVKFS